MPIKTTALPPLTVPASDDVFPIVDISADTTKKITRENFLAGEPLPRAISFADGGGVYTDTQYFTSSGSYVKPAGLKFVIVEGVGGGGGSGGIPSTTASQATYAAGGGGGGYFYKKILASDLSASETVTVGAGGAGGAAGVNVGSDGTTTSFGAFCSATGGAGGSTFSAATVTDPQFPLVGAGGTGTGGDLNITGSAGGAGQMSGANGRGVCGSGGASQLGGSRIGDSQQSDTGGKSALVGLLYGGGASAPGNGKSQSARAGGAGGAGIVIVNEYF